MDNQEPRRLPHPRLLVILAAVLAVWAIALLMWWSRLQHPAAVSLPVAKPELGSRARVTSVVAPTAAPTLAAPPVTYAVVRAQGELVREEDWLALAQAFEVDRAMADIAELTAHKYAGRAVGSPGGKLAGDWIAERFAEYGLQPAGDNGTYFQEFPVPYAELSDMPSFELIDATGQTQKAYVFRQDYTIWLGGYADGGQAQGPVIWLSDCRHQDYDNLDARGSIVLCRYSYPFDDIQRQALEHGAKGLIIAAPPGSNFRMRRTAREDAWLPQGIPTLLVTQGIVEDLLAGSALTLDDLTVQYAAQPLATRVRISVPLYYEQDAVGRNVLGVLPGSDPDGSQQVFVIGGHYDHMGADPDGTVWVGANDNASGVAVLLEIARSWQEHGYVPKRTVLFGAWDGEEIGLFGSQYYVEHPRFPLDHTVGMLQLDMVGAGTEQLAIDAGGLVADQSVASASLLDLTLRPQSLGRSDHAPFVGAGVPATLYIWWDGDAPGVVYHVPEDDITNIEPDRLEAAGVLANLVTLSVSWEQEELEDLAAQRLQAISSADLDAFLATVDPHDESLLGQQDSWMKALIARQPTEFTATVGSPLVAGNAATCTMTLRYRWQDSDRQSSASVPVQWVRRGLDWFYAGPAWDVEQGTHVRLQHLQADSARGLVEEADQVYAFLVDQVGLELPETVSIAFYSNMGQTGGSYSATAGSDALLHALMISPDGYEESQGWSTSDAIVLSNVNRLDTTLAEFALQRAGWPRSTASWLAQGLMDHWKADQTDSVSQRLEQYLPLLAEADLQNQLWAVTELPDRHDIDDKPMALWVAQSWAVTEHLLREQGWAAFQQPTLFELDGWRVAILEPWQTAARGIEQTLQQRSVAVLGGDQAGFLQTVDPLNPVLYREETHWFEDLQLHPAESFECEKTLLSLSDDSAVVDLTVQYKLVDGAPATVSYRARFVARDDKWLYSGVDLSEQRSEHFVLKYEHPEIGAHSQQLLALAEGAYSQVTSDLAFYPPEPIEIKIYHQSELFRYSIYMSMVPARGWTEPGESIKLVLPASESMSFEGVGAVIAHELTHSALFAKGVRHGSVHEGTAQFEAGEYDPQWLAENVRRWRREVYDLVRSKRPLTLRDLDNWREVDPADVGLMYTVGWDVVTFFRDQFGRTAFLDWLGLLGSELSFDEAFVQATEMSFSQFDSAWRESVLRGHLHPKHVELALLADGQRALADVRVLADPAWSGRQAGTDGNLAAVAHIADRFTRLGLQPGGDEGTYYQWFDARQLALTATPNLSVRDNEGIELTLTHGEDFRALLGAQAGGGAADGTILYVKDLRNQQLHLGGRVVLTKSSGDSWRDASDAIARGAGALLLMTDRWSGEMATRSSERSLPTSTAIPVLELSRETSEALLGLAGYRAWELVDSPPALQVPVRASAAVQVAVTPTVSVPNVLGVLPGSDPDMADQVIVVGAHFDHLGKLPDGTIYAGANNDASGMATLLEIARLWHEAGYQPRRTVLFAAWNGTELGQLGSEHYVRHPRYALADTIAMIQLDMVGQGKGYYLIASGRDDQDASVLAALENAAQQVQGRLSVERVETASDHLAFHVRGIPSVLLSWEQPQYVNQPADTPETIDVLKLQAVTRITALTLMALADE